MRPTIVHISHEKRICDKKVLKLFKSLSTINSRKHTLIIIL